MNLELSVIIASYNAKETIAACLDSLRNQKTKRKFEIIIIDSSTDGTAQLIEQNYPEVKLYHFSKKKFCGDARNMGISVAQAGLFAFIDADCVADTTWVEEILKAHESPIPAIGGAIGNANPENYIGWAGYFCEFSQWMPGSQKKWFTDIAGANMSYKKEAFDTHGAFIEGTYCSDTEFHWRLNKSGQRLQFVPSILVSHRNIENLRTLVKHEFWHGRSFARVRIRRHNFRGYKRFLYAALSLVLPIKLFLEVLLRNMRNRKYLTPFICASPAVFLCLVCWSIGECVGYYGG
jgi:GT2 family glycosyltransferase